MVTSLIVSANAWSLRHASWSCQLGGAIMDAMYMDSWQEGDPMHEIMGLSGTDCLWIFGKLYNLGVGIKMLDRIAHTSLLN